MRPGLRRALGAVLLIAVPALALESPAGATSVHLADVVIADVGPGYTVISQGPVNPTQFAATSPDPAGTAQALHALSGTVSTYQRVWQDQGHHNEVQDLVVRLPTSAAAQAFLLAARRSLASSEIVGSAPLSSVSGAVRTTYFATTAGQVGVGQAINMRSGPYVSLLSIFSANQGNAQPITESAAVSMAKAQRGALVKAARTTPNDTVTTPRRHTTGLSLLVAIGLVAIVFFLWSRRTRPPQRGRPSGSVPR